MKIKANLETNRAFELLSTQEGGVEVSWYDDLDGHEDVLLNRVTGWLTILADSTICVPFERNGDYWVCVISPQGDVSIAETEDYPPPEGQLVSVFKEWREPNGNSDG